MMKRLPLFFALTLPILIIMIGVAPSVFSKMVVVAMAGVLFYVVSQAKNDVDSLEEEMRTLGASETWVPPPDDKLVATILENLKREPSEQLQEMISQSSTGKWSPQALQAARLLLDQRTHQSEREPVYRTSPRTIHDQLSRESEAVAPGFPRHLLKLDVGSTVFCPWRNQAGTIIRWDDKGDRFYIRYENGEGDWATLSNFF